MGFLDFFKGTGSPSREGIVGSVVHTTLGQSTLPLRQTAKSMAMDGIRALEGDPGAQQRLGGLADTQRVDQFGTPARPTAGQLNPQTRGMMQQYGYGPQGPARQPTFGDIAGNGLKNLVNAFLPQPGGALDRLTRGGVTNAAIATTIAVGSVGAQGMQQTQAPVVDRSTYSAAAIAEAKAQGRDTRNMVLTAEAKPVVAAPSAPDGSAQTFPVRAPGPIEVSPLSSAPAINTTVSPTQAFAAVSTPAAPAVNAPAVQAPAVAEFHAKSGDDVYARAQAYVAKNTGPGAGPG